MSKSYLTATLPVLHILVKPNNYFSAAQTHVRIFFFHLKRLYCEKLKREAGERI